MIVASPGLDAQLILRRRNIGRILERDFDLVSYDLEFSDFALLIPVLDFLEDLAFLV